MESEPRNKRSEFLALAGLLSACAAIVFLIAFSGSGHRYTLRFETAGQLVKGNEVRMAGPAIGTVKGVSLGDDYVAEIGIEVEERLREGTRAVIRTTSQSGIANRYVSLIPGPPEARYLAPGSTIDQAGTTAPVDFDQLLDSLGPRARTGLREVIAGNATIFAGNERDANQTFRYLWPALAENRRLLAAIASDQIALERFLDGGGVAFAAIADRDDELTSAIESARVALAAIAGQADAVRGSLEQAPPTLAAATGTLAGLTDSLSDLDPLVKASLPATEDLAPFLGRANPVLSKAAPVVENLAAALGRTGRANDLADLLADLPAGREATESATPRALAALSDSEHIVRFARPYAPDLVGWLTRFGQASSYYDANGHYARVQPGNANIFTRDPVSGLLASIFSAPGDVLDGMKIGGGRPCPGAASGPALDGSSPFTDHGRLTGVLCDPAFVASGP